VLKGAMKISAVPLSDDRKINRGNWELEGILNVSVLKGG